VTVEAVNDAGNCTVTETLWLFGLPPLPSSSCRPSRRLIEFADEFNEAKPLTCSVDEVTGIWLPFMLA
jgi:hypothetical protein